MLLTWWATVFRLRGVAVTEAFQITPEQAEAYEQLFVPALFAQWASPLVDMAQIAPGQQVLDHAVPVWPRGKPQMSSGKPVR